MSKQTSHALQFSADLVKSFRERLHSCINLHFDLIVHENRSTMLNLLEKSKRSVRLSVHKMFLMAPDTVISAIAHYVQGSRENAKKHHAVLRHYIQEHLANADYTHLINQQSLIQRGEHYHLQYLYESLNRQYFAGNLQLSMTWYGKKANKRRACITFGQYLSGIKLIKIHRILDDDFFPDYFVRFVIFHEMLHSVVPGSQDRYGRYCFHNQEFKLQERAFEDYEKAILWEKRNIHLLFQGLYPNQFKNWISATRKLPRLNDCN